MKKNRMQTGGGNREYSAPAIEALEVFVEKGFATSTGDLPITDWGDGEVDWWANEQ